MTEPWPPEFLARVIKAMCPEEVCRICGKPRRRIIGKAEYQSTVGGRVVNHWEGERRGTNVNQWDIEGGNPGHVVKIVETLGFTDCGHNDFRPGVVLDPFTQDGTTEAVANALGRDAIGIDPNELDQE